MVHKRCLIMLGLSIWSESLSVHWSGPKKGLDLFEPEKQLEVRLTVGSGAAEKVCGLERDP